MGYDNVMEMTQKRPAGRPKGSGTGRTTKDTHISLEPDLLAWLAEQPGGVSATIRRLVVAARDSRDELAS